MYRVIRLINRFDRRDYSSGTQESSRIQEQHPDSIRAKDCDPLQSSAEVNYKGGNFVPFSIGCRAMQF